MIRYSDNFFTAKKMRVTFILSMFVFIIHTSTLANYDLTSEFGKAVLKIEEVLTALARTAVPLFMIISGALFFRNYTYEKTKSKILSRVHSLVIPYLIWNTIWMCFDLICSYTPISQFFIGREKAEISLANIFLGVFFRKYNLPFWFIEELIIFVFICPITYTLVKHKRFGFISLCILLVGDYFKIPHADSYLFYCVGAYIGTHYYQQFSMPLKKGYSICAVLFLIVFITLETLQITFVKYGGILIVAALSIWAVSDLFSGKSYHSFERCSFLIYAMHVNVGAIITKLLVIVLPRNELFACFNYILTIIITVSIVYFTQIILDKYMPRLKELLCGR